ncbi:MAG: hypothetical protein EA401_13750 [Planctomycetota bacterium]|nr:MAG: hypothetical protein EA401_13750 [Planctomycetota bacterium]
MIKVVTRRYRVESNPEDLLQQAPEEQWYVLRVPQREEQRAAQAIQRLPGAGYLMLWTIAQHHYGRKRTRETITPFLPGYVIVHAGGHDADAIYTAARPIVELLPVPDGRQFIDELRNFCRLLQASPRDLRQQPGYAQGDPVEVIGGAMEGCRGQVVRHHGNWELVVGLTILGTVVHARIDTRFVRPVGGTV